MYVAGLRLVRNLIRNSENSLPAIRAKNGVNLEKDETPLLLEWGLRLTHNGMVRASKQPCSCPSQFPRHGISHSHGMIHVNRSHFGSSLTNKNYNQTGLNKAGDGCVCPDRDPQTNQGTLIQTCVRQTCLTQEAGGRCLYPDTEP